MADGCSGIQMKYTYTCCPPADGLSVTRCREAKTACSFTGTQDVYKLSPQAVQCRKGEAITGWAFDHEGCEGQKSRYTCVPPPPPSPPCTHAHTQAVHREGWQRSKGPAYTHVHPPHTPSPRAHTHTVRLCVCIPRRVSVWRRTFGEG